MTTDGMVVLAREGLQVAVLLCVPALGASLLVGMLVSFVQAVTQMQDQTLSFIPKIAAAAAALAFFGPWMLSVAVQFARHAITQLPHLAK